MLGPMRRPRRSVFATMLLLATVACASTADVVPHTGAPVQQEAAAAREQAEARGADQAPRESSTEATDERGLRIVDSTHDFATTVQRAESAITERGLKIMATVDHASNARGVGIDLRPTTLFIFGNPKAGTQLMQAQQSVGIDLPMKLLVWQDPDGAVHVGYNDPSWIARRHDASGAEPVVEKMTQALGGIAASATGSE